MLERIIDGPAEAATFKRTHSRPAGITAFQRS